LTAARSVATSRRIVVIVRVCGRLVVETLVVLATVLVGVNERAMVVLMLVIVGSVLELAEDTARVVM
jgi:hypothetical protein